MPTRAGVFAPAFFCLKKRPVLMSLFLITFLVVYTFMNAVFFFRVRVLFLDKWIPQLILLLFLMLMIIAPMGSYVTEKVGKDMLARIIGFIGFNWMGFVFLAFCFSVLMSAYDMIVLAANAVLPVNLPLTYARTPTLVMLGFTALLCLYGAFEAWTVRVERVTIQTDRLPKGTDRLTIAQISDMHLGIMSRDGRLGKIIDILRSEKPDILVSTGDLVDGAVDRLYPLTRFFNEITPRYGKYAVTGNHEAYAGLDNCLEFMKESGFIMLRGDTPAITPIINIVGIDDPTISRSTDETALLSSVQNGLFTLFLKHRPLVRAQSLGLFDLQLSGHAHRGQIFPFNYVVAAQFPLLDGYYELGKGSRLYTSRGTGSWGPQIRVLSPPEITIFELVRPHQYDTGNP